MRWLSLLIASIVIAAVSGIAQAMPNADAEAAYARGDYETAFKLWLPLAENGSAQAQLAIGRMYEHGEWVAQDKQAAMEWYSKAADQSARDATMSNVPMPGNVAPPASTTYTPPADAPPDTSNAVLAPPLSKTVTPLPQPVSGPQPVGYPQPAQPAPAVVPVVRPVYVPVFHHHFFHHR